MELLSLYLLLSNVQGKNNPDIERKGIYSMKKLIIIISIVFAIMITLFLGKNLIVKSSLSSGVRAITGLKLDIKSMNVGLMRTFIGIDGMQLFNPVGYVDELMIDMPEIFVDYDLGSFFKGKAHLEAMRLNLREFFIIKNEKGELNLDSLRVVEETKGQKEEKTEMPELQIDILELKIGKVVYKDYTKGTPPKIKEFNVNIDERYENITDPYALSSLIIVKALKNTTVAKLANFNLVPFQEEIGRKLIDAKGKVLETHKAAEEEVKKTVDKAVDSGKDVEKKIGEKAKETVEKATGTFKKIFPFGK